MYKLTYNAIDNYGCAFHWTGSYTVMMDKQETLIHAYDYDPDCFTLTRIED